MWGSLLHQIYKRFVKERKLMGVWTFETTQNLKKLHGTDLQEKLVKDMAKSINKAIRGE